MAVTTGSNTALAETTSYDPYTDMEPTLYDDPVFRYYHLKASLESVETPALLAIGIMGFVGACFSSVIFVRERSAPNDFFLYKIISACAVAQMLVLTIVRLSMFWHCERNYACSFFWAHISIAIMNVCADAVDFLTLFLSIERTWACLLPFKFKTVNQRVLERTAVTLAFTIAILFSTFQAFELTLQYDSQENRYRDVRSAFAESDFYAVFITANTVRFYATACLLMVATVFSIFGFWRTAKRSLVFSRNRDKRRELDLCCLQLCTAAPVVINHLLYAVSLRTNHHSFDQIQPYSNQNETSFWYWSTADGTIIDNRDVEQRFRKAEAFEYMKTSTNLSDALAHALQFYFYLIFCLKVRQGFLALWSRRQSAPAGYKPASVDKEDVPILCQKKVSCQSHSHWWIEKGTPKLIKSASTV